MEQSKDLSVAILTPGLLFHKHDFTFIRKFLLNICVNAHAGCINKLIFRSFNFVIIYRPHGRVNEPERLC